ncbi:MAG TPA: SPFH domain-containing protein [Victivallales bacterium]|nr:SPFH domain-containing protein [Victivallales bacterium]
MNNNKEKYSLGLQALIRLLRYAFLFLSLCIVVLLAWYIVFAGYFTVNPQERAIVLRFGKIVGEFKEGWHWVYPYPISKVIKIPATKQTLKTKTFWHKVDLKSFMSEEDSPKGGPLNPAVEGYLLTGDANIIHTEWELVYEISDAVKFYTNLMVPLNAFGEDDVIFSSENKKSLGTRGPRTFLKYLLENTIIKTTAKWNVDQALYKDSYGYNKAVQDEFIKELQKWDFGINPETIEINFTGKTPPLAVVPAFRDVIGAEADMSREIQNAKESAVKVVSEAEAEKTDIISQARVYRSKVVSQIESEENYFKKILFEYKKNPDTALLALYNDTVSNFMLKVKDKYLIPPEQRGKQELRIMLNPEPQIPKEEDKKGQK